MKRFMIRVSLMVILICCGLICYVTGKAHVIILDNKDFTSGTNAYSSLKQIKVKVGNEKPVLISKDKRAVANVSGPFHTIYVEIIDAGGGNALKTIKKTIRTFNENTYILSIPAMMNAHTNFLQKYTMP